jgi:hypothetical protein
MRSGYCPKQSNENVRIKSEGKEKLHSKQPVMSSRTASFAPQEHFEREVSKGKASKTLEAAPWKLYIVFSNIRENVHIRRCT